MKKRLTIEYQDDGEEVEEGEIEGDGSSIGQPIDEDLNSFARRTFGKETITEVDLAQLIDPRVISL